MFTMFDYNRNSNSYNDKTATVGNKEVKDTELNSIYHVGPINLINTKVIDAMEVSGPVEIQNSNINNLNISGVAKILNSVISGDYFKVAGLVKIICSQINCPTMLGTQQVEISCTTIQEITINNNSENIKETLILNNSIVNGNIIFKSGNGMVKSYSSQINGEIIGGTLIPLTNSPQLTI